MITKITNISCFNTALLRFEATNVYFNEDVFCYIGNDAYEYDKELDGTGRYIIPGLIDIHMHIESSMTTPTEFSNTVLPMGTTTIVADAHEIANVFGVAGLLKFMNEETRLDIFHAIPSSVPSTNEFLETTGGKIDELEVRQLLKDQKVIALGEVMNYHDVISSAPTKIKRIIKAFKEERPFSPIEGHIPNLTGIELAKFISSGIGSDHTLQSPTTIWSRVNNGILLQIQEKSITKENIDILQNLDGKYCFVTDDVMPDHLIERGHLNHCVKEAIRLGLKPEKAIYASTYVPAYRMNLIDRGIIAPGKKADFIILTDLTQFLIEAVYKNGQLIGNEKQEIINKPEYNINSIALKEYCLEDFILKSDEKVVELRVMERNEKSTYTKEILKQVEVINNLIDWKGAGLCLVLVYNRYQKATKPAIGFLANSFVESGAICSSWAHDNHNIIVMGNDIEKMYSCLDKVVKEQGGIAVYNKNLVFTPLRYGGIISLEPMISLAEKIKQIRTEMTALGYLSHNAIMSFAVLTLPVSPELKITDKGYVRVSTQELVDWKVS